MLKERLSTKHSIPSKTILQLSATLHGQASLTGGDKVAQHGPVDLSQACPMPSSVSLVTLPFCLPGANVCCHTEVAVQAPQQGVAETSSLGLSSQQGQGLAAALGLFSVWYRSLWIQRYPLGFVSEGY